MRITFLNQKGGVGKSTVSILVGAALHAAGYKIAFDDRDNQGSLTFWANEVGKLPLVDGTTEYDVVICDTPGRLNLSEESTQGMLGPLISNSDRTIIVSEKSLFSTHATLPMVEFVKKHLRPETKAAVLFNKVRSNTTVGKQNEGELSNELGFPSLNTALPLSASFENIQSMGFSAVNGKHRELVLTLALEILK